MQRHIEGIGLIACIPLKLPTPPQGKNRILSGDEQQVCGDHSADDASPQASAHHHA